MPCALDPSNARGLNGLGYGMLNLWFGLFEAAACQIDAPCFQIESQL